MGAKFKRGCYCSGCKECGAVEVTDQGILRPIDLKILKNIVVRLIFSMAGCAETIADSAVLAAKIINNAQLIVYQGAPHGIPSTHKDKVNADLLTFIKAKA